MKINKIIFCCFLVIAMAGFLLTGCKKTHEYTLVNTTDDTQTQSIIANDELNMNYEFDQAVNDALIASSVSKTTGGGSTGSILYTTISGAVIDTNKINTGLIKITYYGKNGDNTKGRTGIVQIIHGVDSGKVIPWGKKGAVATLVFDQYEVTFLKTNKTLWLNGTGTITNISGGMLKNIADSLLVPGGSLSDRVTAELIYTSNDNAQIIKTWGWNFNQLRFFNFENATISMKVMSDNARDNFSSVVDWGVTRSDQSFNTSINTPVIQTMSSSFFLHNPLSGVKIIQSISEPITITYGVDEKGNSISTGNPYGYKITWMNSAGQTQTAVISYSF